MRENLWFFSFISLPLLLGAAAAASAAASVQCLIRLGHKDERHDEVWYVDDDDPEHVRAVALVDKLVREVEEHRVDEHAVYGGKR
jgi:hypothetical protein